MGRDDQVYIRDVTGDPQVTGITIRWPSIIEFGKEKFFTLKDHLQGLDKVFFLADPHIKEKVENLAGLLEGNGIDVEISTNI